MDPLFTKKLKQLIEIVLLLLIIAPFSTTALLAQNTIDTFFLNQQTAVGSYAIVTYQFDYETVEGTPYTTNHWTKGSFLTESGVIFTDVDMKFEAVAGLLVIQHNADSVYLRPSIVKQFQYGVNGQSYLYKNGYDVKDLRITNETYLMVLHEGDWSIYKHVRKQYKEADFDPVFSTGNRMDSFQDINRYIIKSPDGTWSTLNPTRRNINRLFGSNSGEVTSFIRAKNLDLSNDFHLGQIFEFASRL
jgi:hypothetical protein